MSITPGFSWTDDLVADLIRRWAGGETAREISGALGCSRNAVIGKLNRIGHLGKMSGAERFCRLSRAGQKAWADPVRRRHHGIRMKMWWLSRSTDERIAQGKRMRSGRDCFRQHRNSHQT